MNSKIIIHNTFIGLTAVLAVSCASDQENQRSLRPQRPQKIVQKIPDQLTIIPQAITGTPRSENDAPTGGYAPSNVQAQLKIDVKDSTREVKVIRDNTDPYVITKPYRITKADPYAVRSYLEAAVGARTITNSPTQVMAVRFADGTGAVLVSAEDYRFKDTDKERGIDSIVALLDRKGLTYVPDAGAKVYFPKISRAANLRDMLLKVGSSDLDPEFAVTPSTIQVDGELNALLIKAPDWAWQDMRALLVKYDRPIPEVKIHYKVLEIYAENDDRIGVDFQSWKNNEGVDLFSAGAVASRNWGTFFASGVNDTTGSNKVNYWNFNPKWNTRYLDFMTTIGKARIMASGTITAQNRQDSVIEVNSGFFYDRNSYRSGQSTIAEACDEFAYTDPNPDAIQREAITKILPYGKLQEFYSDAGSNAVFKQSGYVMRMMGTQTGANTYADASGLVTGTADALATYLTGYFKKNSDGTIKTVNATWYNTDGDYMNCAPGIIHGMLQYPMVADGFHFAVRVNPIVTANAAKIKFDLQSISLLGWNGDGSPRRSDSETSTTVQIGYHPEEVVIGGLKKSESVRGTAGLPYLKDIPVIGRALSTETESIKQSQLVLIARVEISNPNSFAGAEVKEDLGKIIKGVNKGMTSRGGNMLFQQYLLDDDRQERNDRLNDIGDLINDEYKEVK